MGVAGEGTLPAAAGGDGAAGAIAELAVPFTYAIPFAVLLLGIAIIPLFKPHLWEKWYGLYGVLCSVAFVIPFAVEYGVLQAIYELLHSFFLDYLPFITLIFALYVTAGGIVVEGTLSGSPLVNTVLLLVAAPLASLIGTTGASMLLVRPLIRSVSHRVYQRHTVVFFIFIASNVAGALTPIGDPPVYLGFLKGVDFFWPLLNVWGPTLLVFGMLLLAYYSLDLWLYRREKALNLPHHHHHDDDDESEPASDEEEEIVEVTAEGQKSEDVEDQKQERKLEAADSTQDSDGMKTITSGSETTSTSTEITPNPNDMHDVVRSPVATVAHSSEGSPPPEPPQSYRPLRLFPLRQADEEHSLKSRPSMNGSLRSENQSLNSLESGNVRVSRSSSRRSSHSSARHSHHSRRSSHHSKPASVLHEVIEAVMGEDEEVEENGADSDTWSEVESVELPKRWGMPVWVEGWVNVGLTLAVVVVVVTSGYLKKTFEDYGFYVMKDPHDPSHGIFIPWVDLARIIAHILIGVVSYFTTPKRFHRLNKYTWHPFLEVAILFINIFFCLVPILIMFELQESGALGFIVSGVKEAWHFFWISGVLSGFLDNAPTYLLFFNVAGGDADVLMTEKAHILQAITCGAVFFGGLSYIGNAPNMLVRNIAVESGVKMPSFVGYLVWACGVMLPMFALVTVIFFRP